MKEIYIAVILTVCVIGSLLTSRKSLGLPLVCTLAFAPATVNIIAGTVNIWVTDLLGLTALLFILLRGGARSPYRFLWIDLLLPTLCLWRGVCLAAHGEDLSTIFQQTMRMFSPYVFPYLVGRMACKTWDGLKSIFLAISLVCAVITCMLIFEAASGRNVLNLVGGGLGINPNGKKWGIWRSRATFTSIHIAGMYLSLICLPVLSFAIAKGPRYKQNFVIFIFLVFGAWLTTSGTGVMTLMIGIGFFSLYPFRANLKPWLWMFLFLNILAHFISKDGLHYVYVRRLSFMGEAYYRAVLIDEVFSRMPGKWIFGLGTETVKVWFVDYEDICNLWLAILAREGVLGVFLFISFFVGMLWRLKECYNLLYSFRGERLLLWAILSSLVALAIGFFFISLYGSDIALFMFYFGVIVSLPDVAANTLRIRLSSS